MIGDLTYFDKILREDKYYFPCIGSNKALLSFYATSPDFALKSEVLECFAMCQHCTIVEFSILFLSFAGWHVFCPPALHTYWTELVRTPADSTMLPKEQTQAHMNLAHICKGKNDLFKINFCRAVSVGTGLMCQLMRECSTGSIKVEKICTTPAVVGNCTSPFINCSSSMLELVRIWPCF